MFRDTKHAIVSYVEERLPYEVKRLITAATWDLLFGPYPAGHEEPDDEAAGIVWVYPGFEAACDAIREAWPVGDLYVDEDDYVTDTEPQPWEDEGEWIYPEYGTVAARDVKRIVLGELAPYV